MTFPQGKLIQKIFSRSLILLGFTACLLIATGCDQTPEYAMDDSADNKEQSIPRWLDGEVEMSPQEWLVKRSRDEVDDPEADVENAALLLVAAAERYDESYRMIANRMIQLEDMLFEQDINETAVNLLEWFVELPELSTPHSLSALCQYYSTLRGQGKTRAEIAEYWAGK